MKRGLGAGRVPTKWVVVLGLGCWVCAPGVPNATNRFAMGSVPPASRSRPAHLTSSTRHPAPSTLPAAEKIGEHRYRIGRVVVDTARRQIRVPCRVNMRRGAIEFLAVAAEGKLHESVLFAEAEPIHVHVALLLLGLDPGSGARYHGDLSSPSGPGVQARVEWQAAGRTQAARLEEFAWDIPSRRPMPPVAWLFTGVLPPARGQRTAEERSLVATYRDPGAVLTNPLPTGADDTVYKVNERLVPAVGTPVTMLLHPAATERNGSTATPDAGMAHPELGAKSAS